ncbi:PAQR family membrane homeostasis protein TrhA [Candidatus Phytoplasma fraxini]|uniref:Hemolysin III family protein n=1 Tax=Ash yellows phytoplasma TaxID=35780 RepID=A0ABZ2U7Z9_ASHYP
MKWPIKKNPKQTVMEEILNAVSHGLMVPGSVCIFCIFCCKYSFDLSLFLLTFTMFMLYFMSCLYHSLSFTKAKKQFQRFDHICIYLLIWGSFLPFLFLNKKEIDLFTLIFFILQSLCILIGILFKIFKMKQGERIHFILFLILGWSGIIVIFQNRTIFFAFDNLILLFLFLGGLFYSIGTIFYVKIYKKYFHFIWHLFVILGNLCHVFSIYNFVLFHIQQ